MFPASGVTTLAKAWNQVTSTATALKQHSVYLNNAASITRMVILNFGNTIADALERLDQYSAASGLEAYAKNELHDVTLNIAAEYTAMRTQIVALQDWIVTNFPKDTSGNLVVYYFDAGKRYVDIELTSAQLSAFKTQLKALIVLIN